MLQLCDQSFLRFTLFFNALCCFSLSLSTTVSKLVHVYSFAKYTIMIIFLIGWGHCKSHESWSSGSKQLWPPKCCQALSSTRKSLGMRLLIAYPIQWHACTSMLLHELQCNIAYVAWGSTLTWGQHKQYCTFAHEITYLLHIRDMAVYKGVS